MIDFYLSNFFFFERFGFGLNLHSKGLYPKNHFTITTRIRKNDLSLRDSIKKGLFWKLWGSLRKWVVAKIVGNGCVGVFFVMIEGKWRVLKEATFMAKTLSWGFNITRRVSDLGRASLEFLKMWKWENSFGLVKWGHVTS